MVRKLPLCYHIPVKKMKLKDRLAATLDDHGGRERCPFDWGGMDAATGQPVHECSRAEGHLGKHSCAHCGKKVVR